MLDVVFNFELQLNPSEMIIDVRILQSLLISPGTLRVTGINVPNAFTAGCGGICHCLGNPDALLSARNTV